MYEIKMWINGEPSIPAWKFFVHDDHSIELTKSPDIMRPQDRAIIDLSAETMMNAMENTEIADMSCNFLTE